MNDTKMNKQDAKILLLYLYQSLIKICKKADIKCYAYQGTLLGAVKYQGMIPWDDDMDFVIFRKDYDLFLKTCLKTLESPVVIQCRETDPYCCNEYFKLCFKDELYGYSDVSLDVFIFDNTNPKRKFLRYFQNISLLWLYYIKRYIVAKMNKGRPYKPKNIIKRLILSFFSKIKLSTIDKWHKKILLMDNSKTEFCINWGSHYNYNLETYLKCDWNETVQLKFENVLINAPMDYHKLLSQLYGSNYMQPYPVEKQINHNIRKLNSNDICIKKIKEIVGL